MFTLNIQSNLITGGASTSPVNKEDDLFSNEEMIREMESFFFRGKSKKLDFNKDGRVDEEDMKVLKDYLDGKAALSDSDLKEADLNHDGKVDRNDLIAFVNLLDMQRQTKDKVRDLQQLYETLLAGQVSSRIVLGVDNIDIDGVKSELEKTKSLLNTYTALLEA